jgi:hypothetical protein
MIIEKNYPKFAKAAPIQKRDNGHYPFFGKNLFNLKTQGSNFSK